MASLKMSGALKDEILSLGIVAGESAVATLDRSEYLRSSYVDGLAVDLVEAYGKSPMRTCSQGCSQNCGSRAYSRCC